MAHSQRARFTLALALLIAAASLTFSGARNTHASTAAGPAVTMTITDTGISGPDTVPAGYVAIDVTNAGTMPHDASFIKLNPGVTLAQMIDAAQNAQGPDGLQELQQLAAFYGGPTGIAPGATVPIVLQLTPGTYAVGDPQNLTAGVAKLFTVGDVTGDATAPAADLAVTQREFAFDVPETVKAGTTRIAVHNAGAQTHEMVLVKLDPGYTLQDVQAAVQGGGPDDGPPAWAHPLTGWDAQAPGLTGELTLDLTPGSYALLCFMPDTATGQPHALKGMISSFTAQ